ncbi:MAG: recombinase family protein [Candidatus Cloacimonetes bacterium]|nr:recombinase family protein [Candidatus Cloacimonadota bacterium]
MKWSLRKHAEQGIRHLGSNRILGYNEVDGVLVPNQDAWIVRVIFEDYAAGLYPIEIHRHLMDLGAANSTTKRIPGSGNMRKVLSNEVYVGDRMIQKGPVGDLITKQPDFSKPYTSYYLTDDHKPNRGPAVVRAGEGTPWVGRPRAQGRHLSDLAIALPVWIGILQ